MHILYMYVLYARLQKKMVSTRPRQIVLSLGQMSLCSVIQRTSKHLEHNYSAHFSRQTFTFSSFQLAQRTSRVKSWTGKREDSLAHWTSASQSFSLDLCTVLIHQKIHVHDKIHGSLSKSDTRIVCAVV